ncbi:MAG: FliH/SctL family protein, partial [Pseudomonadota bacterium]
MSSDGQPRPSADRVRDFDLPELAGRPAGGKKDRPVEADGFIPIYLQEKPENPLEVAQRQADEMLASAQGQAADIRQKSQEEGYQAGYASGLEEGLVASKARIEAACDNLGRATAALERARAGVLLVMEQEIIALVQAVSDRILLAPGAVDPDLIRRVVREAIGRVSQAERLAVRLNPDDLERVREFRPRLLEGMGRLKYLDLLADPELRPGDCLVDGPQAQVDATLATRRGRIFQLLEETFHQSPRLVL